VAGIFVPILNDAGYLQNASIGCPAQQRRRPLYYTLADLEGLYQQSPERFQTAAAELGGNYAYSLGYEQDQQLFGLRRDSGDTLPILADCVAPGAENSTNHGSAGQNVLFVGGSVRWCALPTVGEENDHIYLNDNQRVLAGVRRNDTVLATSGARPYDR
jgi:hypothetical protein